MLHGKLLVVDDEAHNVLLLKTLLKKMGHTVEEAANGNIALSMLNESYDLVLTDVMMPEMDGFTLVTEIRRTMGISDIPIIMVTALREKADRLRAVEAGANDFITKPVDRIELEVRTRSLMQQKRQQDEIKEFQAELENKVARRTQELQTALHNLDQAHIETIHHLSAAAEYKDEDTADHIQRVSAYSDLIAQRLGLDEEEVALIRIGSPMHDVGKIGISDRILLKPGKLDAEEWEIMKTHTTIGDKIMCGGNSQYMKMGAEIALTHHEKWDGSGYPHNLSGENIPLSGRICAVADVFDALTSRRPYKEAFPVPKSLAILREGRGSHFDPRVLDAFLEQIDTVLAIRNRYQGDRVNIC